MAAIHFLSEVDKIKALRTYRPIISDMDKEQLEIVLMLLINGLDLEYAFDVVIGKK